MTDKTTRGYTKSPMGKIDLLSMLKKRHEEGGIYKDPNEPFEVWFNRKIEEQFPQTKDIAGGMDEQGMSGNGDTQSSKPLA